MPLPAIFAGIVAAAKLSFVQAVAAVVRAFVWSLIVTVTAKIVDAIVEAAQEWLIANGPEIIGKCIELELELELNGDYTPEGFTDAINRKYDTDFRNLFDPKMVEEDAEDFAVKKINEAVGREILVDLSQKSLEDDLPAEIAELLIDALEGADIKLFSEQVVRDIAREVAELFPAEAGPQPPRKPIMSRYYIERRRLWKLWRETKEGYRCEKLREEE